MIYLGLDDGDKRAVVECYRAQHDIRRVVAISADEFPLAIDGADPVAYSQVIMYITFYRLLQEIDERTLVVINECLRTQNRYDLTYNCIRNFLNQTGHQLVFQHLPQIDTQEDFMILFDLDTRSRWKRRPFDPFLVAEEARLEIQRLPVAFERVDVPTSDATRDKYDREREKMFSTLGKRDPHIIPRNLYLIGGADKRNYISASDLPLFSQSAGQWVARNKRLGNDRIVTYDEVQSEQTYGVLELPHRFIDFSDFIRRAGQASSRVLAADLKVDRWYFQRYTDWSERIHETYASLSK
jgi:hypothetical protein